jgi:adenine phosphoribosyltransferase
MTVTLDSQSLETDVRSAIRDVPDFPKPGIVFKDITPLLADARLFRAVTDAMAAPFASSGITHVVAIESRGFILGAPVAQRLGAGFIPVRKPGKLPHLTSTIEYELEYGTDQLQIHTDACNANGRVLIVDDVLATGGTAAATHSLLTGIGAEVAGFSFLMVLGFLPGLSRLTNLSSRIERILEY